MFSLSVMSSIEIGHCRVHFCVAMGNQPLFTQAGGQSAIKGKMSQNNLIWIEKYTIDWTMLNCFIYKENGKTMHSVLKGRRWLGIQREIYITSIIGNGGKTSSITSPKVSPAQFPQFLPQMAMPERKKGSNTSARVSPTLIQPWSTLIQPFGVSRADYGPISPIYGNLGPKMALFGHKYYPKCWKSVGTRWITILHHQTDQKNAKVVSK